MGRGKTSDGRNEGGGKNKEGKEKPCTGQVETGLRQWMALSFHPLDRSAANPSRDALALVDQARTHSTRISHGLRGTCNYVPDQSCRVTLKIDRREGRGFWSLCTMSMICETLETLKSSWTHTGERGIAH